MKDLESPIEKIIPLLSKFGSNAKYENQKIYIQLNPEKARLLNSEFLNYFSENKGLSYPQFEQIENKLFYELKINLYYVPYISKNKLDISQIEKARQEIYRSLPHFIHNLRVKNHSNK